MDESFFANPRYDWQRQYEALRAYLLEQRPAAEVAGRLGYEDAYVRQLAHRFRAGALPWQRSDWSPAQAETGSDEAVQSRIRALREQNLSAEEIAGRLAEEGIHLSSRTVRRILDKAGYPRLAKRSRGERQQARLAAAPSGAPRADAAAAGGAPILGPEPLVTPYAGLLLLLPVLRELDLRGLAREAGWPEVGNWAPGGCLEALLLAKLAGVGCAFHRPAGKLGCLLYFLAGLSVAVDPAVLSRYVWEQGSDAVRRLQFAFNRSRRKLNVGDERAWSLVRQRMSDLGRAASGDSSGKRGASASVVLVRAMRGDHLLLDAWDELGQDTLARLLAALRDSQAGSPRLVVCGSRMLSYGDLALLDRAGVRFITHRRRGEVWLGGLAQGGGWRAVSIAGGYRSLRGEAHEAPVVIRPFDHALRQIVFRPGRGEREEEQENQGLEMLSLLTNAPEPAAGADSGLALEDVIRLYRDHVRRSRIAPGVPVLFGRTPKDEDPGKTSAALGGADESVGENPSRLRLDSSTWPAPLMLDLILTQVAEVAAVLLARRLTRPDAPCSAGLIQLELRRPGKLHLAEGRVVLETADLWLYRNLTWWTQEGAFNHCAAVPAGGLGIKLG